MGFIEKGKEEGANVHMGGERHGSEGYFIQPTIFTDAKPGSTIVRGRLTLYLQNAID
jgi:aldehyde dehydrogenase (NAD+)